MSAESGKIFPSYTSIEIDERGVIWLIQNHFESDSVITEMESTARGSVIIDEGYDFYEPEGNETYDSDFDLF